MIRNAKRGLLESGPSPKSNAVVADLSMPQAADTAKAETDETAVLRDHWAAAKRHYLRGDFPDYASDDWRNLEPEDPRKLAGALMFAEMWRKYGDEIASDLHQRLAPPHSLWTRPTLAELDQTHTDMVARNRSSRKEAA